MRDIHGFLQAIRRSLPPPAADRDDGLLAQFVAGRDEAAFAELVARHGPMVFAACRRLLPNPADAEDAFQAAFLVLARRAGAVDRRRPLGPWLYRVAVLTARNLRRRNARRVRHEAPLPADPAAPHHPETDGDLDAALAALPERYRAALVLCHLEGRTRGEAAALLGRPEGTISSDLARGLDRLRRRFGAGRLAALAPLALPAGLASAAARAALAFGPAAASTVASTLSAGVLRMMLVKKTVTAVGALVAGVAAAVGPAVLLVPPPPAAAQPGLTKAEPAKPVAAKGEADRLAAELKAAEDRVAALRVEVARRKAADEKAAAEDRKKALAAAGPHIHIRYDPANWGPPIEVTEVGDNPAESRTYFTWDHAVIRLHIRRALKEAEPPKRLVIVAAPNSKADAIRDLVSCCEVGGLKRATYTGPMPVEGLKGVTPAGEVVEVPGVAVFKNVEIDVAAGPDSNGWPKPAPTAADPPAKR